MTRDFEIVRSGAGKPKTAGLKATAKRLRNGKESRLAHRTSIDWRLDVRQTTTEEDKGLDLLYTDALMDTVLKSKTVESLLSDEKLKKLEVLFDKQIKTSQLYVVANDDEGKEKEGKKGSSTGGLGLNKETFTVIITLNPNKPKGVLVNTLTKELRHAWQYVNGALLNPMDYEPDNAILLNRAEKADALVFAIKAAWELNLAGESDAWDYMLASPIGTIVREFEKEVKEDFRTFSNGEASRKVYDSLFGRNHTKVFDKQIIHQMLLDDTGYMKKGNKKPFVTVDELSQLGDMPFSTNYIAADKEALPVDDKYSKVEDRSNANFLWFIKFERQYQAKEFEMTKEVTQESAKVVDFSAFRKTHNELAMNKPA